MAALATLRYAGIEDSEILADYTRPSPQADRAYERAYYIDTGTHIAALGVKAAMRGNAHQLIPTPREDKSHDFYDR